MRVSPFRSAFITAVLIVSVHFVLADDVGEPRVSITPRVSSGRNARAESSGAIRLDVKVVLIPVTVTDIWDKPIAGLSKDDFHLFEDNTEQQIVYLSHEEAPASVGLIFDASGSMRDKLETSVAAVEQFWKTTLPGDEFMLVRFSDKPRLLTGFTHDTAEISGWLHSIQPGGWTALYDAIYMGIHKMKTARNARKALLVLTDGGDNSSRYSAAETRGMVREADVRIYSIGLLQGFLQGARFLEKISDETGGKLFRVRNLEDLPEAIEKLSLDLRSQYVLGYYSNNAQNDGRYRKVRVQVSQPNVRASWRRGYYAPFD